jgi:choline dehydrogenase-like flavoprotein
VSREYDVLVVGGGTAGAVVAARLSEDPRRSVGLVEWGPDDRREPRALQIRRWFEMLEGEYDLDYRSVPQPRGNSHIRQARARILGGCSSHNTMIALRPPDQDFDDWAARGAGGWDAASLQPLLHRLATRIEPVAPEHRNPYLADVITAASAALGIPVREDWNAGGYADGAGWLPIGYTPETGVRSSSSVAYLHPIMDARPNLDVITGARALRVTVSDAAATGVLVRHEDRTLEELGARAEVVLCCGAIDTPRLLLLSGIGPGEQLRSHGLAVVADVPGVGENLTDHPEGLVVWQAARPVSRVSATDWDVTIMARLLDPAAAVPDVLSHVPLMTYAVHAEMFGLTLPEHSLSLTPNVTRPRSRGRVWLAGPDPDAPPLIDYRAFTDPEGYDERVLLAGMRMARRVAAQAPMADWVGRELFPGADVEDDEELSAVMRATHHTVYHVSCTCRMGALDDPLAVLDPSLRVRGVRRLSVADASAFPSLTTVNPVVAVLMLAERAAELVARRVAG